MGLCFSLLLTGCATGKSNASLSKGAQHINETSVQTAAIARKEIAWRSSFKTKQTESLSNREALQQVLDNLGETGFQEKDFNDLLKQVNKVIAKFQGSRKRWFQASLSRAEKYMPMINGVFSKKRIPQEMAWLALIESGFTYDIKSPVGARGMWQFMPRTAQEYGLKVSRHQDQRLDPYLATIAARAYLLDRVAVYGSDSFLLVAASYNAGEGRISRALRRLDDPFAQRNFIGVSKLLPKETRGYVPNLLAAAIIGRNPESYGFTTDASGKYAYIQLRKPSSIARIAKYSGLSTKQLRALNPELSYKKKKTPMNNFIVRVPAAKAKRVVAANDTAMWWQGEQQKQAYIQIAQKEPSFSKPRVANKKRSQKKSSSKKIAPKKNKRTVRLNRKTKAQGLYVHYKVQRGNTLNDIALWFNKPIAQIKTWNPKISKSGHLKKGQIVKVYGLPRDLKKTYHKVQKGDSLSVLAQQYQVSKAKLKAWNGLRSNKISRGKSLLVYHQVDYKIAQKKVNKIIYKVKSGNYLAGVAALFDVSIAQVKRWNQLKGGKIYAGQKLVIQVAHNVKKKIYTVKRGDSLGLIANRIKAQSQDLRFINGLKKTGHIRAGQRLVYFAV